MMQPWWMSISMTSSKMFVEEKYQVSYILTVAILHKKFIRLIDIHGAVCESESRLRCNKNGIP